MVSGPNPEEIVVATPAAFRTGDGEGDVFTKGDAGWDRKRSSFDECWDITGDDGSEYEDDRCLAFISGEAGG